MLDLVVFISGALVMVLEMVGARVLAPHLGTSVVVWTSLIGVLLACLAAGAWFGGRLADRTLSPRTLAGILAGAGVGTGATALLHHGVGGFIAASIDSAHLAAVAATVILFAVPGTLCGMVAPYVIRLRLADLATSGSMVGRLYALSTAGSIIGTFLGGFVLVSWFPSTQILFGTAAGFMALSVLVAPKRPAVRTALLVALLGAGWATASYADYMAAQGGPRMVETPYNHIRIMEGTSATGRPMKLLATDPGRYQSAMYADAPDELALPYTRFYGLGLALAPHTQRVLMLGGGGLSVARWLLALADGRGSATGAPHNSSGATTHPANLADVLPADTLRSVTHGLALDVVEIDPGMTRVAREHFATPADPRMYVIHEDARRFLNRNTLQYDLVLVDVFGSHYAVPFHAGTVEAAHAMRRAVDDDGLLLMNVISAGDGPEGRILYAIRGALAEAFAEVHVFAVHNTEDTQRLQNFMLLALPRPRPDLAPLFENGTPPAVAGTSMGDGIGAGTGTGTDHAKHSPDVAAMRAAAEQWLRNRWTHPLPNDVPPLRDDFAPVERYALALLRK